MPGTVTASIIPAIGTHPVIAWEEERYLLGQDTRLLFVRPDGRALHSDTITALFHKHCVAAGLTRIRLHDVRHSYATAALKAGISPKIISERSSLSFSSPGRVR